jgi:hypothetical protein
MAKQRTPKRRAAALERDLESLRNLVSNEELEKRTLRWLKSHYGFSPEQLQDMPDCSKSMVMAEAEGAVFAEMAAEEQQLRERLSPSAEKP